MDKKTYNVIIRASVTKAFIVEAINETAAIEQAREQFTTEPEPCRDEYYTEDVLDCYSI